MYRSTQKRRSSNAEAARKRTRRVAATFLAATPAIRSEDDVRAHLLAIFDAVDAPGDFVTFGDAARVTPALLVPAIEVTTANFGALSVPLTPQQAQALERVCSPAPFGRGARTLHDPAVRSTAQLSPSEFRLQNAAFADAVQHLARNIVAVQLGCSDAQRQCVSAELYKLLLYRPGDHFAAHVDTEKEQGMFGTLIVQLPSRFTGGELVVRHSGEERIVDLSGEQSAFGAHYAAFYADCEHEVRPITSGYRLVLVYNLCCRAVDTNQARVDEPTAASAAQSRLCSLLTHTLRAWNELASPPPLLAYVLDHAYTLDGLTAFESLKNRDGAVASLTVRACRESDSACMAFCTTMSIENDMDEDAGDEVFDSHTEGGAWISPTGADYDGELLAKACGNTLSDDDFLQELGQRDADSESRDGPTGNEGSAEGVLLDVAFYHSWW
jgi:predicted 2-oxoglutarate/Fe(II)-dependent dioxygenase YbiX